MTPDPTVTAVSEHARYSGDWYYCWLIERRDLPQPEWFGADCFWHKNANDACWFARKQDAEQSAGECPHDVIVREHGFAIEARSALADVGGWRCFHCGEVCETEESAVDHFGSNQAATPACRLAPDLAGIVKLVRDQESELAKYRAEDSESHREFYRIGADHAVALRRAEETGYARGLEDAKKHPETLGLAAGTGKQPLPSTVALADVGECETCGGNGRVMGNMFDADRYDVRAPKCTETIPCPSCTGKQPRPADAEILGRLRASESEVTRLADRNHENIAALYAARAARDAFAKRINELEEKQPRPAAAASLIDRVVRDLEQSGCSGTAQLVRDNFRVQSVSPAAEAKCATCGGARMLRRVDFEGTPIDDSPCPDCSPAAHTAQVTPAELRLAAEAVRWYAPEGAPHKHDELVEKLRRLAEQGSGAKEGDK